MRYTHSKVKSKATQLHDDFQLKITSKSFKVFEPLRRLIADKCKHIPSIQSAHVTLLSYPNRNEITIDISAVVNDLTLQAKASHQDAYSAVILAFKKLRSIAKKSLTRQIDRKRKKSALSTNEQLFLHQEEEGFSSLPDQLGFIHTNYIPHDHDAIILSDKTSNRKLLQSAMHKQVTFKPKRISFSKR